MTAMIHTHTSRDTGRASSLINSPSTCAGAFSIHLTYTRAQVRGELLLCLTVSVSMPSEAAPVLDAAILSLFSECQ